MSQLRDTDANIDTHVASNVDTDTDTDEPDPFDYPEVVKAIERCIEPDSDFSIMQAARITDEILLDKDEEPKLRNGTSFLLAEHILTIAKKIPYNHPSQIKLVLYVQCMMQSQKLGGYVAENTSDSGESYVNHFRDNWETFWWTIREWFPGDACSDDEDVNFSAFCARLYGMNVDGWGTDPTYFIYALDYLECDMRIQGGGTERAIRSAALWVLYSGQLGFDAVVKWPRKFSDREAHEIARRRHQQPSIYDGPIYGIQRWEFWRRRLLEESVNTGMDEETKRLARMAADMMAAYARNSV